MLGKVPAVVRANERNFACAGRCTGCRTNGILRRGASEQIGAAPLLQSAAIVIHIYRTSAVGHGSVLADCSGEVGLASFT